MPNYIHVLSILSACLILGCKEPVSHIITVTGPVAVADMGITLPHEHIMVDFIGADSIRPGRYHADSVVAKALPFLLELKMTGCQTLIDCTPNYLGRDVSILKRLSRESGMNIITNTGYYGAAGQKYLPPQVFTESAEQLADRWINEYKHGIDGTSIKPGFIKLGADAGPLTEEQKKIMKAGAITHLQTGLTIAVHSGDGNAAREALEIFTAEGLAPEAFVWVHAQNEKNFDVYKEMANKGVWVEFDGVSTEDIDRYVSLLKFMKEQNLLHRTLISQDAGWYHVGESGGGKFNPFTTVFTEFIPALRKEGFTEDEIELLIRKNTAEAFAVRIRKFED